LSRYAGSGMEFDGFMAFQVSIQPAMHSINNPVVAVLVTGIFDCRTHFYSFSPAELRVSWYCYRPNHCLGSRPNWHNFTLKRRLLTIRFGCFRKKAQNWLQQGGRNE